MANLLPPHRPNEESGESQSYIQPAPVQDVPLLPYERALIAHMGITVEEYAWFKERARDTQLAYAANPPRVVAGGIGEAIIVSLVVGALFTAVGAALAPKPRQPSTPKQKQIKQKNVAGLQGAQRFNQTYGFESVADLAAYGSPIPYVHGRYRPAGQYSLVRWPLEVWGNTEFDERDLESNAWPTVSGGVVINGQVVWSKVYSWGNQQSLKIMMLMGCDQLDGTPDAEGIFLGNNTLDGLSADQYAFYWESDDNKPRLKKSNLIYGSAGSEASGDPDNASSENAQEVFFCATREGPGQRGFSMTYTPQSQTTFGVFAPIPNGHDRRTNWRVISIPESTEGDARDRLKFERRKIAGSGDDMQGVGVGYQRWMGLTKWDGDTSKSRKAKVIDVGETGEYVILKDSYPDKYGNDVEMDDLRNQSNEERQAVDEAMQVSDQYMMGACVLQIYDKDKGIWQPPGLSGTDDCKISDIDRKEIWVGLKSVEVRRDRRIGIVPRGTLQGRNDKDYQNAYSNNGRVLTSENHIPTEWFGLVKCSMGVVRNQRPCEVTEIGLRSNVWGQFTGLCNFNEVPTAEQLADNDEENVNISVGNMNIYFPRYSFFIVLVRLADDSTNYNSRDGSGNKGNWKDMGLTIGVRGAKPIDQYNFIRFTHPRKEAYEYRFYPVTGAYIWNNFSTTGKKVPIMDSSQNRTFTEVVAVDGLGTFAVAFPGREYFACGIAQSPLMLGRNGKSDDGGGGGGGGGGGDDEPEERCEKRYDFEAGGVEDSDEGDYYIIQNRTAAGPGASAFISERWVWDGKVVGTEQKSGTSPTSRPIATQKKDGDATFKYGQQKYSQGGSTAGKFTWEIERCAPEDTRNLKRRLRGLPPLPTTPPDEPSDDDLAAEVAAMTGGCRSCGDSYAAAASTDYRDALRPERDLSWNAQPEEPDQSPPSPPGWELDNEAEDVTSKAQNIDEFEVEIIGPNGQVKGGGRYTREGGFTGNNPCYDESEGTRPFEWSNYIDIKEPEGKRTFLLCKGDTVKIKGIKTTGCKREHLQYELWAVKKPYAPSGTADTLGQRAASCKSIWNDPDRDRKALGGDSAVADGDVEGEGQLVWTPKLSAYRTDEQGNYNAVIRARCRGASYQSGFILGDSFNICLSPNKYCTTCPTCTPKWIEGPNAEEKPGTLIEAKVRIDAVRQITEGTWFVNGVSELKDRQGSLQGDCNLSKDFAFKFTAPQSGNVELKFKYKKEGSLSGYECKGELIKTFKVTANPTPQPPPDPEPEPEDPCKGIVCPDGYVATKTGPNSCECFPITGTDPCKDVECPPGFEAIRTSENTCGCFKISDDPCKEISCPKGFEPVRTGPTTCGCFPIPEEPKPPNTPRPETPPKLIGSCCDYDNKWNNWEAATQIVEHSHYDGLISRSSDSGPEHEITYVNESMAQDPIPGFELCTTAGLSLKANNQINSLDSVRAWVRNGRRLNQIQKSKGDTGGLTDSLEFTADPNASDNFADLVWFLLTGNKLGVGDLVQNSMVDAKQMRRTARYLEKYGLLFNGVIDDKVNVRDYIAERAPFFLCHFTIRNGLFTLIPVFPTEDDGTILDQAPLSASFDDYNIIEDSLKVTYLDQDERQLFHAEMKYRYNPKNTLPEERTVLIKFKNSEDYDSRPTEVFDMTEYCTTREHAVLAGRYFMALRKNITHGVTFKTLPDEMRGIGPGDYIRVTTDALPEKQLEVGSFSNDLEVLMVDGGDIRDGTYNITWWKSEQEDLQKAEIDIKKGRVVGADHLAGALFSITPKNIGAKGQTYMIEQVELDDDGLVEVTASNWPEYGAETSTRLTGAPVANGDSVMTFEVFGKPTETGGGGGDNPPAGGGVCREGITYFENPTCPGEFYSRDRQENGTCYPACFLKGSAVPYNGMALRGDFRSRGSGLGPEIDSNGLDFNIARFRFQVNSTFGNPSGLGINEEFQYGNKDDSDWRLTSFHGYGFNSYYKELALRPANKRVSLPITGVEILPYFPPPQSKNLAGREGVEVRYWLGGQIINRMCFIGILPEGFDPSNPDIDDDIDPDAPAFFDQTIGDPDFVFDEDGNEWTLPGRYALYPFSNNPRFIFGGNRRFSSPGKNDDLISADEKTVYDLADGSVVWTWNEYNPLKNFIADDNLHRTLERYYYFDNNIQFLDTEDTWSNSGICQIPSAFDGYCHVMGWNGSPLDDQARMFFCPYIPLKGFSIRSLNSQVIRDPSVSFLRYSCSDRTDTTFTRQRFGAYWVKRGKNTMRGNTTTRGSDHEYMDGYQTMATNTVWDFGYTPYHYASIYTLNYNSLNYKTGRDIERGHDPTQGDFTARKYGSDERMSLFSWKGTAWIRGGVNNRMEVGALIQTADGSDANDAENYGKLGFYALNLKGHLPPLRCWGISNARYYWEYKGGSGALRPEGMYTGAIIENGEIKIYFEGNIIYEGIAKLYHDDRDVTRNMFAYDCQGGKWEEGPRQRDRRVEMRYAGSENTGSYNSTQATRMLALSLPILLTNYAEKDEKEAGAIYPTIYGDIVLHEWLTVLPEYQDLQPYKLGTGGRLTDFKEGDKWSINHGTLGAFELTDDHDYRGYFLGTYQVGVWWWGTTTEEKISTKGVSWWRYKTPLPGLEYKFQELNEFGDMWPLPRNCPYWPNSVSEYSTSKGRTNYNLRINNRNNPYVGGNGFYSYLGIGELPTYFTQTYQLSNKHTLPKEPDFYAPIGFTRLPFGWNYSTDSYGLVDSIVPYTDNRTSISRDSRWNISRYSARPTYYANGADTTWIIESYNATNYEGFVENVSRNEAINELALQKNVQNLGLPRRPNEYPNPPRSPEELDSYSNFTETEEPLYDGLPEDPFNNTPGSGETGYGAQVPYWIKYWGKLQRTRHPIQVEGPVYKGCFIQGRDVREDDELTDDLIEICRFWDNKSPYMNQPGVTYGQRDRYLEELGEEPAFGDRYRDDYQIWETTSCGHDKMDNFTYPQDVNEIPIEQLVYLSQPRGTDVNDDALASYLANNSDYPPSNPNSISNRFYVQQKVWAYRYTNKLQKRRAHVYQPGWSGDAQTPPMTGVWIQGTEDVGSTAGFEDRSNVPRVSISFFLGGRLIWEHADYIPECGFVDGYYPATNYHPDLDALQETVGNTEGGLFPKGSTLNVADDEEPLDVTGVEGAINTGGSYDHKRRVGSHYLLKESLKDNPPQVMSMDWDVTTVAYKEMRYALNQEYRCDFQVGIYKDATPWFNGEDWSHEGPINGQPSRWEILANPATTSGRNGAYGLCLNGVLMPRNHWYEDAIEHYSMQGDPSDFNVFSGVIIRDKVMQFYYQGERIYVGTMKVYRNQDMYRVEDLNIPLDDRFFGYDTYKGIPGDYDDAVYPQFKVPARPDETNYQFKKIEIVVGGKKRVFGVGRLVDLLEGSSLGTKHLTMNANGEIGGANRSSHYSVNNAVKGSADMRTIWVTQGPGQDFAGYWTLHEYRTEDIMEGPGWDDNVYDQQVKQYRKNVLLWNDYPATIPGEFPEATPEEQPQFIREDNPPSGYDYNAQFDNWNAINQPPGDYTVDPFPENRSASIKRNTRSREEIYRELDPRLVEGVTEDDYDFTQPCSDCTPDPEDI